MKKFAWFAIALAVSMLGACAENEVRSENKPAAEQKTAAAKDYYSDDEFGRLTYCVGLSDTAKFVAINKKKGVPIEKMQAFYAGKEHAKVNLATVKKVYAEDSSRIWDYTISFFNECAGNLAGVSGERLKLASFCAQNSLIADVAYGYKAAGEPKEKAYRHFRKFKSDIPRAIVDAVYSSSKSRGAIKIDVWAACIEAHEETA